MTRDVTLRKAALTAGFGLLIMTLSYLISDSFVFQKLIIPDSPTATVLHIMDNGTQFRLGICGIVIVIICDVLVAWALYVFLTPVSKHFSLLAAWFRLIYSTIFGVALANYFTVLQLLSEKDYLKAFQTDELHTQAMLAINSYVDTWSVAFIFFGLHLSCLGYLVFKSGYVPKYLGIILLLVGLSYLIDYFGKFVSPDYNLNISTYVGWGELIFMLWLLFRYRKRPELN